MINNPYKICDPIHGFIRFDHLEREVIDSVAFQRLRYIRQMGVSYLLYPGANHTRFEHSLGVMELSSRIYDTILALPNRKFAQHLLPKSEEEFNYYRRVLRLAALFHDLGHLPFSHTAEIPLLGEKGHEELTVKIAQSPLFETLWGKINGPAPKQDILKIALGEKACEYGMKLNAWERMLSQIITDDHFGADRIDYLLRDATYTGVGFGHLDYLQLIDTLRIVPSDQASKENGLSLGVSESGLQAVESLLMARYLMFARVYHHPKSRLYTKHMERAIVHYFENRFPKTLEAYLEETDYTVLSGLTQMAKKGDFDARAILKLGPPFEEIPLLQDINREELDEKIRSFEGAYFIDSLVPKSQGEDFLLISEKGEISSARKSSLFLQILPQRRKEVRLFVHPEKAVAIRELISK